MLDYHEPPCPERPVALMLWLHGLGADGYDLEPAADMLALRNVRHVFLHAPVRPVTINRGMAMRAWFDIAAPDLRWQEDGEGMLVSARQVIELAQALRGESGLPVVLAGFSQGAVISLAAAALGVPGLVGVAALSGYLPQCILPSLQGLRGLHLFMAHGRQDEVVPHALGKAGCEALEGNGLKVDWREYAMPHTICQQEMLDLSNWLDSVLAGV